METTTTRPAEIEDYWNPNSIDLFNDSGLIHLLKCVTKETDTKERIINRLRDDEDDEERYEYKKETMYARITLVDYAYHGVDSAMTEVSIAFSIAINQCSDLISQLSELPDHPKDEPIVMDFYDLEEKRKSLTEDKIDAIFTSMLTASCQANVFVKYYKQLMMYINDARSSIKEQNDEVAYSTLDDFVYTKVDHLYECFGKGYTRLMKMVSLAVALGKVKGYMVPEDWIDR